MLSKKGRSAARARGRAQLAAALVTLPLAGSLSFAQTPVVTETAKVMAGDPGFAADRFGFSASVSGDTAMVGEPLDDAVFTESGSVYVFARSAGSWVQQQKLTAADPAFNDNFGHRVVVKGDTALVTAPFDDDRGVDSGSAYIFLRAGGVWTQWAKLVAPDGAADDQFGSWAALDGDTVLLGAPGDDDNGPSSGSAYVFRDDGTGNWNLEGKLRASDGGPADFFGFGLGLHGNIAVIGSVLDDDRGSNAGAAYVFVRSTNGTWSQEAKLTAADARAQDLFGREIAVYGDTALIGAIKASANVATGGAAYVFVRNSAGVWTQQARLTSFDGGDDEFGMSLALEGDTAVVGAWGHGHGHPQNGAAYVFKRDAAGNWTEEKELLASDRARGLFMTSTGGGVSISSGTVIAGGPYLGQGTLGSAYIFELETAPPDTDGDGVIDAIDNCVSVSNPDQTDSDLDGAGDACDPDNDNDGVPDASDNCPFTPNADQSDIDLDGQGDPCDNDPDGDGFGIGHDNCPFIPNPDQTNTDGDLAGDACDADDDNDAVCDAASPGPGCAAGPDICPVVPNPGQEDLDGDAIGDACDADLDGDGHSNDADNCPIDSNVDQNDVDSDGLGDTCDSDIDNDGRANAADNCPSLANTDQLDSDNDGLGNACDSDLDGDGVAQGVDNCPLVANSNQFDFDNDTVGDACDPDVDGDRTLNAKDTCPATPAGALVNPANGCSIAQLCPCAGPRGSAQPWRDHGTYVSCVTSVATTFANKGLITYPQRQRIIDDAWCSSCGY